MAYHATEFRKRVGGKITDSMSFQTASGFPLVYTISYYALKQRANLKPRGTHPFFHLCPLSYCS